MTAMLARRSAEGCREQFLLCWLHDAYEAQLPCSGTDRRTGGVRSEGRFDLSGQRFSSASALSHRIGTCGAARRRARSTWAAVGQPWRTAGYSSPRVANDVTSSPATIR